MVQDQAQRWLLLGVCSMVGLLRAGDCGADELTQRVLQSFHAQAPSLQVTSKSDDELQVRGPKDSLTVYLFNIRTSCTSNKDHCDDEMSSFVQRVASVASSERSAGAFLPEKTYAVLRSAGFGKRTFEMAKDADKQLVVLPFVDSIEVLFVVDGEKAVRFVRHDEMLNAGLTEKSLLDLAAQNSARLPTLKYETNKGAPGLYFMPAADGLGTSRAFDPALWEQIQNTAGGPLAVAVPTRDWILFTRADQPDLVVKLRELVGRIVRGEPYPVSTAVMTRDGASWKVLPVQ